ncbi:Tlg2-vesicle protein [Oleoguttula sp. CCFEE 5521]
MPDYTPNPRSLALPTDEDIEDEPLSRSASSFTRRRSNASSRAKGTLDTVQAYNDRFLRAFLRLPPLQQAALVGLNIALIVGLVLTFVYHEKVFARLKPVAVSWRALPGGWLILWFMTILVSFPPMIGYSTCVTLAGFVYGMHGWFIVSTATVLGSTLSFIVSRTLLKSFVGRMTEKNKQFAALSLVLKHDGLKLLMMIRLCPLPYSLSNGAISTIPTVTWYNFALATAAVTPKLLLHVFIGRQIGQLAETKMDAKTKAVSYASILLGMAAGIATGWFIWTRTKARAEELEREEEAAAGGETGRRSGDEDHSRSGFRQGEDDMSLHTAYADEDAEDGYRDEFTDDEDAAERDVFDRRDLVVKLVFDGEQVAWTGVMEHALG